MSNLHEYPITLDKQIAQCKTYHRNPDHLCGVTVFKSLPAYVTTHLVCKCEVDYREERLPFRVKGIPIFGFFCLLCGKSRPFSLHRAYFTCEGCYKFYSYDFREFDNVKPREAIEWPPQYLLCKDCDVPVSRITTGGFSFS